MKRVAAAADQFDDTVKAPRAAREFDRGVGTHSVCGKGSDIGNVQID